jgi:hypothetical protein
MPARVGALVAAFMLVACGPSARDIETILQNGKDRGPGAQVSLATVVPGATRVFVFGPYTPLVAARRCLGGSAPNVLRGLEDRDDVNVLVFQMADGDLESVAMSRAAGDFGPEATGRSYAMREAEFVVRRSGDEYRLVPVRGVPSCM